MTKIKICGLTSHQDIEAVNKLMPDYIGFVFAKSERKITYTTAKELREALDDKIRAVGVFVNEEIEHIASLCNQNIIDMIQIHGDEDEDYLRNLKLKTDKPVIRAFRIRSNEDIKKADKSCADYILLDSYVEGSYGGSGHSFSWNMVKELHRDYFLAGGIHAGNVMEAVSEYGPYCIDVSSGVETKGKKDKAKMREVIEIIRKNAM